jgi:hypothetical protein
LQYFSQIAYDWDKKPFTDIMVKKTTEFDNSCPREYPEEVFYKIWKGMHNHCDCYEAYGYHT